MSHSPYRVNAAPATERPFNDAGLNALLLVVAFIVSLPVTRLALTGMGAVGRFLPHGVFAWIPSWSALFYGLLVLSLFIALQTFAVGAIRRWWKTP